MRLIFLSIDMPDLGRAQSGLYADILYSLSSIGHSITVIAPSLSDGYSGMRQEGLFRVLRVPLKPFIGNIPFYIKGFRILCMSNKYKNAYKKYLGSEEFDYIIMATPPSTLVDVVKLIKTKSGAKLYLILRDIHPECLNRKNVSSQVLERDDVYEECKKPYGVNPVIEKFLYYKSQSLYRFSDIIGCMSPGNQSYIKSIAPYLREESVVLLPNWYNGKVDIINAGNDIREKYNLQGKFIAIFGGTIGEAQAVWNIAQLAKMNLDKKDVVFLVVGRGVRKKMLEEMAKRDHLNNMVFLEYMPREDYEAILQTADLGLISIDEKYKVPTSPSKVIGYMALAKPVLAMFNKGNDYGEFYIDKPNCGLWADGLDYKSLQKKFEWLYQHPLEREEMGENGYKYYKEHFTTDVISKLLTEQLTSLAQH